MRSVLVRLVLAAALGIAPLRLVGQSANVAPLWEALGSDQSDVADAAITKLVESPNDTLSMIERHLAPLLKNDGRRIQGLIEALDHEQFDQRESGQQQLAVLGKLAEPKLRRALESGLPLEAKSRVEYLLNGMPGPFARSIHDRRLVRLARLLERLDTPRADAIHQAIAPAADLQLVDSRILPLYELLDSPNADDRADGAIRLTELGEIALPTLPRLIEMLSDDGPHVKIENWSRSVASHVEAALPRLGNSAVEPLIRGLAHPNTQVRSRVVTILGSMQDERAIAPLIKALADAEYPVSGNAGSALKQLGPKAVPPLIVALKGEDTKVRGMATYILGEIRDERAIAPLAVLLHDDDQALRETTVEALRKFGSAAVDELVAALNCDSVHLKRDGKLRAGIVTNLGITRHPKVVEPLMRAIQDEREEVRSAAAHWLAHQPPEAISDQRLAELDAHN